VEAELETILLAESSRPLTAEEENRKAELENRWEWIAATELKPDIQEKMPPDETPGGDEFTPPEFTPSGKYLYHNDRNAPVRYDKQIPSDQAWNFDCVAPNENGGNMTISLSAKSLDDLPAAPATQCQGKKQRLGIEGTNRGRVVISGNGVLSVFDSELGRMDFETSKMCRLR
jgi:hypothetical protein